MSAYIEVPMAITDRECLLIALGKMGFGKEKVKVHDTPVKLIGYEGSSRNNEANIVIPKMYVGSVSNDLGFLYSPTGYRLIVSDYDSSRYGIQWKKELLYNYDKAYHQKIEKLQKEAEEKARQELIRIEKEKEIAREKRKETIIQKAKKLGYRIEEKREGKEIKLVLLKRVY